MSRREEVVVIALFTAEHRARMTGHGTTVGLRRLAATHDSGWAK